MNSKLKIDPWFFIPITVLVSVSMITLFSIDASYFKSQFVSLIVGLVGFLIFSNINMDFLKQLKTPIYIISLILLLVVLVIGIEARGASRWFELFGVRVQFSEILKPFLALSFAAAIDEWTGQRFKSFLKISIFMIPVVILITLQPDLGSGILFAAAGLFGLLVIGYPMFWFLIIAAFSLASAPIAWNFLHGYQRQRILTFINKTGDPLGTSYNGIQAIIAVGSGSIFGNGISEGTQSVLRFLPERQTDFIFATISEGLGFFGASIIILAFFTILYRIFILFRRREDLFGKAFLAVSFGFIFMQGFVNIAMNMGLLPIVGITFPFVSFGGSSLLSNFIFLGLIASLSVSEKNIQVLEIR